VLNPGLFPVSPTLRNRWPNSCRRSKPPSGFQHWTPPLKH
jgi:hypothetical protein